MNKINQKKKKKKSERKIKSKKSLYDMVKNYKAELKDAIKLLITFISTQEDITWNSKGELYFKNRKIRHSNIGDLIKHAVDNSVHEKVVGKEEFYKILGILGIPSFLILNEEGKDIINKFMKTKSEKYRPPGQIVNKND